MQEKLRVLPNGGILVLDPFFAAQFGKRKYIGRATVQSDNEDELPENAPKHTAHNAFLEPGEKPLKHAAYPPTGKPAEFALHDPKNRRHVQAIRFIRKAVRKGDLLPADEFTAKHCGVPFAAAPKKTRKDGE